MTETTAPVAEATKTPAIAPATPPVETQDTPAPAVQPEPQNTAPEGADADEEKRRRNREFAERRIAEKARRQREAEEDAARLRAAPAPKADDFADPAEYDRAMQRQAAREALADVAAEQAREAHAQIAREVDAYWTESVETFRQSAPDFDAAVQVVGTRITPELAQGIKALGPDGAALVYHLARSPGDLARLASLPPTVAAVEAGLMVSRLKAPPRRVVSSAPPPVAPVVGAGGPVTKSPAEMTQAEYDAWRRGK
jgi:hypothetical protein